MSEGEAPFLDYNGHICTLHSGWSRKQRRLFQRLNSGFTRHMGEVMRLVTLTSSDCMVRPMNEGLKVLVERVKRLTVEKLYRQGYLKVDGEGRYYCEVERTLPMSPIWRDKLDRLGEQYFIDRGYRVKRYIDKRHIVREYIVLPAPKRVYAYKGRGLTEPFKFDRLKVSTGEGVEGVYHIVYFGDFIPQRWLKDNWRDITGAEVVDIRASKKGVYNPSRLARYLIGQYFANQSSLKSYSCSKDWVFKGFVRVWRSLMELYPFPQALAMWNTLLSRGWLSFEKYEPPPMEVRTQALMWKKYRARVRLHPRHLGGFIVL